MARLVVPISGTGSLFKAMIDQGLHVSAVFADRPCPGLEIARAARIPRVIVDRRQFRRDGVFDREGFTAEFVRLLQRYEPEIVPMAGFMTVLAPNMYIDLGRLINIHPSLLPLFKGEHAVRDALAAGVRETGSTVHIATNELDEGPILAQERVPILPGDTLETLWERIKAVERTMYPRAIRAFAERLRT